EFQFMRSRFYQARIGRFAQQDMVGIAGGLNIYSYGVNAPTGVTDPLGDNPWDYNRDINRDICDEQYRSDEYLERGVCNSLGALYPEVRDSLRYQRERTGRDTNDFWNNRYDEIVRHALSFADYLESNPQLLLPLNFPSYLSIDFLSRLI